MELLMQMLAHHVNPMAVVLALIIAFILILLILLQLRKDTFDLRYLIMDTASHQPSIYKIGQLAALIVSTWGFVYLTLHDKLTEFYFTAFMAIWAGTNVGNNIAQRWFQTKIDKDSNHVP